MSKPESHLCLAKATLNQKFVHNSGIRNIIWHHTFENSFGFHEIHALYNKFNTKRVHRD